MPKRKKRPRKGSVDLLLVPQALKIIRQAAGLRQTQVSERSGLTKAMISAYETGKNLPSLQSLSVYLNAIDRDLGDLQEAIDDLGGFPSAKTHVDARERAVGRAVLRALQGLEELEGSPS
jgi:transcriptional regulator with XRE-family HTH domain